MTAMRPGLALLPLRVFLGGTFTYAGIQKLADPGFLHPGAPTFIGTQLQGFASGTPGGFVLRAFALPHPVLAGIGVAIIEIVVGLFAALGLLTRPAAVAGMGLSLLLFLTASWHTSPYFLGPDLVFAFAWLPFALGGAAGQPALDHLLRSPSPGSIRGIRLGAVRRSSGDEPPVPGRESALTRRVLVAEVGGLALAVAGIAALFKGSSGAPAAISASPGTTDAGAATSSSQPAAAAAGATSRPPVPANAVKLGSSSQLAAGQGASYQDPSDGQADIVIRQPDGSLTAFSAVCTHAGCTVGYQGGQIACPCHGALFNAQTGAVEGGPAPSPLTPKSVIERNGAIYAVPS